ncbi:MAG: hypothetical protein WCG47_20145 [Dermatophilaceae bacterium]
MTPDQPAPAQPAPSQPALADTAVPTGPGLAEYLPALLREARIETVELDVLHRRPSFQGSEVSSRAQSITDPARDEHRARGFGFWEFVLAEAVTTDSETRRGLLDGALRHNSDDAVRVRLRREEFIECLSSGEYEDLPPRDLVSFCSPVEVFGDEQRMHLPLLDLGVKPGPDGQAAAMDAMHALGLRGLLFESGRSYHFYGADPVTPPDLVAILGRAQLLSPIIDSRWVSHQLIDGRCGLRISTDSEKTPAPPVLVARVGTN